MKRMNRERIASCEEEYGILGRSSSSSTGAGLSDSRRKYIFPVHKLAILMAAVMLFTACGSGAVPIKNPEGAVSKRVYGQQDVNPAFVQAQNQFGLELHRQLAAKQPGKNVFISPYSVAAALSMIYHGAAGETHREMSGLLHTEGLSTGEWNQNSLVLRDLLEHAGEEQELSVGNSVWLHQGFEVKLDYIERTRQAFGAEVSEIDFKRGAKAAKTINSWVKRQTEGRIPSIVDESIADSSMVLVNTVYFNAQWQTPFPANNTKPDQFQSSTGSESLNVQMMRVNGSFPYRETDRYQAVQLPYIGERMDMLVVVPKKGVTLTQLQEKLWADSQFWGEMRTQEKGVVELPKFEIETGFELNEALQTMGMREAFDGQRADFSGITDDDLAVTQVNHKTFVRVDERGTEAAAATSIHMAGAAAPEKEPFHLRADRPFLAAIRSTETGALLFVGSVYEPEAVE